MISSEDLYRYYNLFTDEDTPPNVSTTTTVYAESTFQEFQIIDEIRQFQMMKEFKDMADLAYDDNWLEAFRVFSGDNVSLVSLCDHEKLLKKNADYFNSWCFTLKDLYNGSAN